MYKFSCFADEISADLQEQISVVKKHNIEYISFRSVWDKFVGELYDDELKIVKSELTKNGIKVSSIGSHIGKITMDKDFEEHMKLYQRILDIAKFMEAKYVRIFSFFMNSREFRRHENEVIDRLGRMVRMAEKEDIVLIHENETEVFGESCDNCVKIYDAIKSANLMHAFDPCNFVNAGENVLECLPRVKDRTVYMHVKDFSYQENKVVMAGKGDGHIPEVLEAFKDRDFMFLTIEPHLISGDNRKGTTGPDLFSKDYYEIVKILDSIGAKYE